MYNARSNADRKAFFVAVDRSSMKVCFWPDTADVAVENPTYMKNVIYTPPVDSEGNVRQQQPSCNNLALRVHSRSLLRRCRRPRRLCI